MVPRSSTAILCHRGAGGADWRSGRATAQALCSKPADASHHGCSIRQAQKRPYSSAGGTHAKNSGGLGAEPPLSWKKGSSLISIDAVGRGH
jgi:hypothetical protein